LIYYLNETFMVYTAANCLKVDRLSKKRRVCFEIEGKWFCLSKTYRPHLKSARYLRNHFEGTLTTDGYIIRCELVPTILATTPLRLRDTVVKNLVYNFML